jgi:rod shape-determining protein MreC
LLFTLSLALALLLLGQAEIFLFERARQVATDMSAPLLELAARPVGAITQAIERTDEYLYVFEENRRLREENERLRAWRNAALSMEGKLARLEALLDVQLDPAIRYVTARVLADTGGPFVHTLMLNIGESGGIEPGHAVITNEGLIGRVVGVGRLASRVLLLTDLNSRVPVFVEPGHHRAILAGDNTPFARLEFLPGEAELRAGDRVITSGHGGLIPPGLYVGLVTEINGQLRVGPATQNAIPDFVRVLRFAYPLELVRKTESDSTSPVFDIPAEVRKARSENAQVTSEMPAVADMPPTTFSGQMPTPDVDLIAGPPATAPDESEE